MAWKVTLSVMCLTCCHGILTPEEQVCKNVLVTKSYVEEKFRQAQFQITASCDGDRVPPAEGKGGQGDNSHSPDCSGEVRTMAN